MRKSAFLKEEKLSVINSALKMNNMQASVRIVKVLEFCLMRALRFSSCSFAEVKIYMNLPKIMFETIITYQFTLLELARGTINLFGEGRPGCVDQRGLCLSGPSGFDCGYGIIGQARLYAAW